MKPVNLKGSRSSRLSVHRKGLERCSWLSAEMSVIGFEIETQIFEILQSDWASHCLAVGNGGWKQRRNVLFTRLLPIASRRRFVAKLQTAEILDGPNQSDPGSSAAPIWLA